MDKALHDIKLLNTFHKNKKQIEKILYLLQSLKD